MYGRAASSPVAVLTSQSTKAVAVMMGQPAEERAHGRITMKTYYRYFTTEGGHLLTLLTLVVFIAAEVTSVDGVNDILIVHIESLGRVQLLWMTGG